MLASRLQQLPPGIRWIAANMQGWIQALGMGMEPVRGPWERRSSHVLMLADRIGLTRPFSFAVNMALLIALYASQFRVRQSDARTGPIFIGIQALRETGMARYFADMQGRPIVQIDGRGMAGFMARGRVKLRDLCREMLAVRRGVWKHLAEWESLNRLSRLHAINFLMMRGHQYAYLCAWFRQYLRQQGASTIVACTASSSPAYAAVAVGAQVVYMLHGFQRRSIVYPDFTQCVSMTAVEAEHLRSRLPGCEVITVHEPQRRLETQRVAAVAGTYWEADGFDRVRPFIEWARRNDILVVVRPHPVDPSGYWEQWRAVSGVEIAEDDRSFERFLDDVRPRFVASWYSTVLFDALAMGVVPVTVCPDSEELIDTVYPVRELSICWPQQEALAQRLVDDDDARAEYLARQFARAMNDNRDIAASSVPAA